MSRNYPSPEQPNYGTIELEEIPERSLNSRIAEGCWVYGLDVSMFLSGAVLSLVGVLSFIPEIHQIKDSAAVLDYISAAYLILFGVIIMISIIRLEVLETIYRKWFVFLLTFRGRGVFLIFLASLTAGFGNYGVGVAAGVIIVGLVHIFLACFYKNKLRKKPSGLSNYSRL
eukprot:TRINITY_DN1190_c0_g1_i4.p1 TRINITY_DN1190_c0_g1~~TRINITY_DN1190_c0_g1_i4.p1  ORF type:complete len:171 (+),score=9.72 TRINITY_DN1190_c0_g1_i4:150-662(+)